MDSKSNREIILKGNMYKAILTLSIPIMLGSMIQTLYDLADTFWVSKIGYVHVAAISLIWPIIFFMMSLGMGLNIAGTALISQYIGSGNKKDTSIVAGQIITFSFLLSTIVGLVGGFFSTNIVSLMGAEGEVFQAAVSYLKIIFIGMPTMFVFFAFNSIKHGQGDTITPTKISICSAILNVILDPIFIFDTIPFVNMPGLGMGIAGAALATVLSRAIFAVYAIYTLFDKSNYIYITKNNLKINKEILWRVIKIGIPSSIGQSTTALGFAVLNFFILSFGDVTMAAFGIGNRINSLILMPVMGTGSALATIVGQNLGADNVERAKESVKKTTILSVGFMTIGGIVLSLLSPHVVGVFTKEPEVLSQGTYYLRLISASLPLMGVFQVFMGVFQGSGHTMSSMVIAMGRLWGLRIPMIVLFKNYTNFGHNGVWYAMVLSNALICVVGYGIYATGNWQHKVIKEKKRFTEEVLEG